VGSVAVFLVFCAARASHLRRAAALRALAANLAKGAPKASSKPELVAADLRPRPDSHVMALARDPQGYLWIGTEDDGVYRYDPDAGPERQWTQFTTNDGLGDNNAYAIACDKQGRVWAGELNHGVAVFNGENWKNYDVLDGPIGERVFRIAICPTDGDVWMATSAGLTRYSPDLDTWRYYTRADGLPSDQANSLAFDAGGNLYVGTQCDGIAIGSPASSAFAAEDIKGWPSVINQLKWQSNGVSAFLWQEMSKPEQLQLWSYQPSAPNAKQAQEVVLQALNKAIAQPGLYEPERFRGISLRPETANLLRQSPVGLKLAHLNRLLLEDSFSVELARDASAAGDYQQWRVIPGPDELPTTPSGSGLPSALINDLLVTRDQRIFAATTAGLAFSTNAGRTWQYIRGGDYTAKVRDLGGDAAPEDWQSISNLNSAVLVLPEDFVTCLAEDKDTNIWMGFRTQGYAVLNSKADKIVLHDTRRDGWLSDNYVTVMLPGEGFRGYFGSYGGGLMMPATSTNEEVAQEIVQTNVATTLPRFPLPAKPPTAVELTAMLDTVMKLSRNQTNATGSNHTSAVYLGQDWRTLGDWTGRYGRQAATLSAMAAPMDHNAGWSRDIKINGSLGPHHYAGDSLRYWAGSAWLTTSDPRALYSTVVGHRRITEWDDHGESYPMSYQGPDIWVQVGLPAGVFRLAFYFVDYNGHYGVERFRDYLLELKACSNVLGEWEKQPTLARARVQNFWSGEYQCFIVTGPAEYALKIGRNYSFNTMCQGVFVDRLIGPGFAPTDDSWLPYMEHVWYKPPDVPPVNAKGEPPGLLAARELWTAVDDAITMRQGVELLTEFRLQAYRAGLSEHAPEALLANWRWKMPLWTADDRTEFWQTVQKAYVGRTEQLPKR
jgi:sugar lactone lactonase YvrE